MKSFLAALAIFFTHNANAVILTFDEFEIPGERDITVFGPVDIGEYRFTPLGSLLPAINFQSQDSRDPSQANPFYSGSAGISAANGANIILTRVNGQGFSISSLDIDQVFALTNGIDILFEMTGTFVDGGLITQTFSADAALGYESLTLTGFSNIASLRLSAVRLDAVGPASAGLANWDNFDLAPVPLPSVVWLFGSGLLGLLVVARRR